jgi:hypothetical protein
MTGVAATRVNKTVTILCVIAASFIRASQAQLSAIRAATLAALRKNAAAFPKPARIKPNKGLTRADWR